MSATAPQTFTAGECWAYRAPKGFERSRIIVGAVVSSNENEQIVCCAVERAPRRLSDGRIETVTIPFLPMAQSALADSVEARDGHGDVPAGFQSAFDHWLNDPKGLTMFTVPFEGWLETLIARQMASIVQLSKPNDGSP